MDGDETRSLGKRCGVRGRRMSEPHQIDAGRAEHEYYRALQCAEAKLYRMTIAKNRAVLALKDEHDLRVGDNENHGTGTHCSTCKLIAELEGI